jgi:hypothetical protein
MKTLIRTQIAFRNDSNLKKTSYKASIQDSGL